MKKTQLWCPLNCFRQAGDRDGWQTCMSRSLVSSSFCLRSSFTVDSSPRPSPAPCSTSLVRLAISSFSCWIVSLARASCKRHHVKAVSVNTLFMCHTRPAQDNSGATDLILPLSTRKRTHAGPVGRDFWLHTFSWLASTIFHAFSISFFRAWMVL